MLGIQGSTYRLVRKQSNHGSELESSGVLLQFRKGVRPRMIPVGVTAVF